jgi:hypothetical protein
LGATDIRTCEDGYVRFRLRGCQGRVILKAGGSRLRGSVLIATVEEAEDAGVWLEMQPLPPSSDLDVWVLDDGGYGLRLVWERTLDAALGEADPIAQELAAFAVAWEQRGVAIVSEDSFDHADPRDLEPEQAWLIVGDSQSWPTEETLSEWAASGDAGLFECLWTGAKQTQAGDLVLLYFIDARKAVHFVARAASAAFYTSDLEVTADGRAADQQWWVFLTPLIEVVPIKFADIGAACHGQLNLKGRSGKFLRPEVIEALNFTAADPEQQPEVDRVCRTPVGRADLPDPDMMSWRAVRELAGGALRLESEVSRYIVEPLLRECLRGESDLKFVAEYPIGKQRADYAVLKRNEPTCIVEVKLSINERRAWTHSPDLRQAIGYAEKLSCRAVLIDASRIVLVDAGATEPRRVLRRRSLDQDGMDEIAEHLGVPFIHRANQAGGYRQPMAWLGPLVDATPEGQRKLDLLAKVEKARANRRS